MSMPRSIYVHIPFCVRKCLYCDFFSTSADDLTVNKYVDALCREMIMRKDDAGVIETVYIGGGTPSILSELNISSLMTCVGQNFRLSENAEITMEANPESLTENKAALIRELGVNRISIGFQSLNDRELALLGRPHDSKTALSSFKFARQAGFDNISIDLIYAIPGQDLSAWMETLAQAADLAPEHISAYELTPEEHTPLYGLLEKGELALCDEEEIASMYYGAKDYLADKGYEHYEISNFLLPGRQCWHNLNYWNRGGYLGLGAGASSFTDECRSSNICDINSYISGIDSGGLPAGEIFPVTAEDGLKETIFLGLRKTAGFDISLVPDDALDKMREALRDMTQQGLVTQNSGKLRLTRKGLLLCNEVIVRLMLCID
jgi:oxygen-independent coproporphyrinogen III oxidase